MAYLLTFFAAHGGDIEASIGKPGQFTLYKACFFMFTPFLLPTGVT